MMLTLLDTVKARLGIDLVDLKDDAILTRIIQHASGRFDLECTRKLEYAATQVDEFRADEIDIPLSRFPLEAVTSFHLKDDDTTGWVAQSGVTYILSASSGVLVLNAALGTRVQRAKVTYSGGYVVPGNTPSGSQVALPAELEQACIEQVAYWYQQRNRLGLTAITSEGGSLTQFQSLDLLPSVKAVLRRYERYVL